MDDGCYCVCLERVLFLILFNVTVELVMVLVGPPGRKLCTSNCNGIMRREQTDGTKAFSKGNRKGGER
jgi:hypothetical protein